jgi:hypothetical protein
MLYIPYNILMKTSYLVTNSGVGKLDACIVGIVKKNHKSYRKQNLLFGPLPARVLLLTRAGNSSTAESVRV